MLAIPSAPSRMKQSNPVLLMDLPSALFSEKRRKRCPPFGIVDARLPAHNRVVLGTGYLAVSAMPRGFLFVVSAVSDTSVAVVWAQDKGELNVLKILQSELLSVPLMLSFPHFADPNRFILRYFQCQMF